ncbi:MAG: hypothetical protein AB1631_25910 [Acidobacteriota bacterium]
MDIETKKSLIQTLGFDGKVFVLGPDEWLLQVTDVFEDADPRVTYHFLFINQNDSSQERRLRVTVSYQYLSTEVKDQYGCPKRLRERMFGWLSDKQATNSINFDQEIFQNEF